MVNEIDFFFRMLLQELRCGDAEEHFIVDDSLVQVAGCRFKLPVGGSSCRSTSVLVGPAGLEIGFRLSLSVSGIAISK